MSLPHQVPRVIVGALIFNQNQELFLMRSSGKYGDQWIIPGGKVDFGESLEQGLCREIHEETNMKLSGIQFCGVRELIEPSRHFVFHEFKAQAVNPADVKINAEATEYGWFKKSELKNISIAAPTQALIDEHWLAGEI